MAAQLKSIHTQDSIYNIHCQNQNVSKNDMPEKKRESGWVGWAGLILVPKPKPKSN
jgi:hypothetical protein